MRVAIFSDLHLTHWARLIPITEQVERLAQECADANVDLVINAGDTWEAQDWIDNPTFIDDVFKDLNYLEVKGNHDYYGGTFGSTHEMWDYDDKDIYLGTMWTNFRKNPLAELVAMRAIADFRAIKECNTVKMIEACNQTVEMIHDKKPHIVVTHFPPVRECVHEKRIGLDMLPNYFVNDRRDALISSIHLWVAGHTHDDFDVRVNDVRIVSNQLGYPTENFNYFEDFHPKVINL